MTSADLNQDGHGDLVVGAPGYSRPGHTQVGRVYLLYGSELGLPPLDLDLDKEAHVTLEGFQVRRPSPDFPFSCPQATALLTWQVPRREGPETGMTRAANGWCPICGMLVVFKILFIYLILSLTERMAQDLCEHTCCSLRAAQSRRSGCDFLMLRRPPTRL